MQHVDLPAARAHDRPDQPVHDSSELGSGVRACARFHGFQRLFRFGSRDGAAEILGEALEVIEELQCILLKNLVSPEERVARRDRGSVVADHIGRGGLANNAVVLASKNREKRPTLGGRLHVSKAVFGEGDIFARQQHFSELPLDR
jgi:hypothetical protein